MRVLADTHSILWWALDDRRLSATARATLGNSDNEVLVSAASAWEIATKARLGKLPGFEHIAVDFTKRVAEMGFYELPIEVDHGERAGSLGGEHKDPFDRILMAQAMALNIPIVSCDEVFDYYRVHRIWEMADALLHS